MGSRAGVLIALLLVFGCKSVDEKTAIDFTLPGVEMNEGAVALQVAVVQVDDDQQEIIEEFWSRLDTMKLPLADRQVADRNGLRYAVMSPQCPAILDQLLKRRELDISRMTDIQKKMASKGLLESPSRLLHHQRIENDSGEEFEIPVSEYYQQKKWSIVDKRGRMESGSGELVKAFMQLSTFPQNDGSVRLLVEPEIHHGQPQQRYDVSQRTFLFSESQIQSRIEALKFAIDLQPGESLIIAPTIPIAPTVQTNSGTLSSDSRSASQNSPTSIGDLFFAQTPLAATVESIPAQQDREQAQLIESAFAELDKQFASSADSNANAEITTTNPPPEPSVKPLCRFLMVRLIHTQASDLFDRSSSAKRLTTINHQ